MAEHSVSREGPGALDMFWWLALQELERMARVDAVELVELSFEEERGHLGLEDRPPVKRRPPVRFSIEGLVLDTVRPLPSAMESLTRIHSILQRELMPGPAAMAAVVAPPGPRVASDVTPAPDPADDPPPDDAATRFGLLELD